MAHEWNYQDDDPACGPSAWTRLYPHLGQAQSPIDIKVDYYDLQRHQQQVSCVCGKSGLANKDSPLSDLLNDNRRRLQGLSVGGHKTRPTHQARRSHLNSTGGESNQDDEDDYDGHPFERSPSQSSDGFSSKRTSSPNSSFDSGPEAPTRATGDQSRAKGLFGEGKNSISQMERREETTKAIGATRYCATNKKLFLGYPRYLNTISLCNTGHTWQVDMPKELAQHTLLCGPPLGDREYRLAQLHCHWGAQCDQGSEHLVNGRAYSAEIHFVHWNCKDFRSFEEAAQHKHGLAVLAVFVQALEGERQNCNKHLDKIISSLPLISDKPNSSAQVREARLDLKKLFPTNRWLYAAYEGSLTTPPLSEVVDWIVFLQPIQCSSRQIEAFRQIKSSPEGEKLRKNCRPVQALNKRTVSIWTHSGHH